MVAKSISDTDVAGPTKPGYPWIGVSGAGLIVLFTKLGTGTAIGYAPLAQPSILEKTPLGQASDNWMDSLFRHYTGKITLYNE